MIGLLIQILITGVVFGAILQLAAKFIVKEGIDFGDAFKAALVGAAVTMLGDYGLQKLELEPIVRSILSPVLYLVVWTLALAIVIGIDLARSLLVAVVFTILTWLLKIVFFAMLGLGAGLSEGAG